MNQPKSYSGLMIITDLDGTFVTPEYNIPDANIQAVKRFCDNGGVFTIATGRSIEAARQYAIKAGIKYPVITTNGAVLYDYSKEEIVWQKTLDRDCAMDCVRDVMDRFPKAGVEIHVGRDLYVLRENDCIRKHLSNENIIPTYLDRLEDTPQIWHKVLFGGENHDLLEVSSFCTEHCCDKLQFVFTSPTYFEMIAQGVSKGSALTGLSERLGIPIEHVVAMGDYYNDIEILSAAGVSALAGNAPEDMRQYADVILCDCHDGVAADIVNRLDAGLLEKIFSK